MFNGESAWLSVTIGLMPYSMHVLIRSTDLVVRLQEVLLNARVRLTHRIAHLRSDQVQPD